MTFGGGPGMAQQRPASGRVARARGAALALAAAALGIQQRAQILESIGRDQAGGDQFPKRVLDFAGQAAGGARKVGEERRAARFQHVEDFAGRVRERVPGRRLRRREEPAGILAEKDRERRDAGGPHTAAARRSRLRAPARRRDAAIGGPSSLRPKGRAGRGNRARNCAIAARQNHGLPGGGRELRALQLPDHLQRAVDAVQLRAGREVLPSIQERVELGGRDRLDLAAQAADGEAVDAREQAAVAPFDARPRRP